MATITNIGTELKLALCLDCAGLQMGEYDFTARFYTLKDNIITLTRDQMIDDREASGTYIAIIDTSVLSAGTLWVEVEASIPDYDTVSGYRREVATITTGILLKGRV